MSHFNSTTGVITRSMKRTMDIDNNKNTPVSKNQIILEIYEDTKPFIVTQDNKNKLNKPVYYLRERVTLDYSRYFENDHEDEYNSNKDNDDEDNDDEDYVEFVRYVSNNKM